jgi:hypothetical protein
LGFRVWGLDYGNTVQGLPAIKETFKVYGLRFTVKGVGCKVGVWGLGFRV